MTCQRGIDICGGGPVVAFCRTAFQPGHPHDKCDFVSCRRLLAVLRWANKKRNKLACPNVPSFTADRSMPSNEKRHVFTYQTRILVTAEQNQMLLEYAARVGRVERTLY